MNVRAIIHPAAEGGYWAEVPALPGLLLYEEKVYVGDNTIISLVFPDLKLTAAQVLHCH